MTDPQTPDDASDDLVDDVLASLGLGDEPETPAEPAEPEPEPAPVQSTGGRHSAALTARAMRRTIDCTPIDRLMPKLAKSLRVDLEPMLRTLPRIEPAAAQVTSYGALVEQLPGPVAVSLLRAADPAAGESRMLFALPGRAVMQLVDRLFGGGTEPPTSVPAELPRSAELLCEDIERALAVRMPPLFEPLAGIAMERTRHEHALADLAYLDADETVVHVRLDVAADGLKGFAMHLAFPEPVARALTRSAPARVTAGASGRSDLTALLPLAMGDIALPLRAVLADMPLAMGRVAGLKEGDVLPLAFDQTVSLRLSERELGRGRMGRRDDRVAVALVASGPGRPGQ